MSQKKALRLTERERFSYYLRTGFIAPEVKAEPADQAALETKFNPYHDPENGRFTFAPGGPQSRRSVVTSWGKYKSRAVKPKTELEPSPSSVEVNSQSRPEASHVSGISLSRTHRDFLSQKDKYAPKPDTKAKWDSSEFPNKNAFKAQYVHGYRDVIKVAAERYDLPPELVGSVAYSEVGNDNLWNDIAYSIRAESGRDIPESLGVFERGKEEIRRFNRPRAETSFGPYNIQQRRAAEILGYGDINAMSETARRRLVPTSEDPVPATFMLAKHLSDLRDQDFPGVAGQDLNRDQLLVVATRFKFGREQSRKEIMSKIDSGRDYLMNWSKVKKLIK
ncbi:MAG: hypothetical protein R3E11_07155 [Sphingobium sp.]|nr:hypothetical protein [Sphingobium sp.]MCP5398089.1 hypothetical protein [Sphingomonas sp.]